MKVRISEVSLAPAALVFVLLLGFMSAGAIPLLSPELHYQTAWPTYLRYGCIVAVYVMLLVRAIANNSTFSSPAACFFIAFSISLAIAMMSGIEAKRVVLYLLPLIAIFTPQRIFALFPRIAVWALLLALAGAVYEYANGTFGRFDGARVSSIFINPNNLAVVTMISVALIFEHAQSTRAVKALAVAIMVPLLFLSGSKTGLLMLAALIVFYAARRSVLGVVAAGIATVLAGSALVYSGLVRAPLLSLTERVKQLQSSLSEIDNWFTPGHSPQPMEYYLTNPYIYVDNAYIQTWIELGVPAAVLFTAALIYKAATDRLGSPFWLLLMVAALTTNINYLWPVAYFLWAYVGQPQKTTN